MIRTLYYEVNIEKCFYMLWLQMSCEVFSFDIASYSCRKCLILARVGGESEDYLSLNSSSVFIDTTVLYVACMVIESSFLTRSISLAQISLSW